jgi:ATP-dependent Clp protease protease subunit
MHASRKRRMSVVRAAEEIKEPDDDDDEDIVCLGNSVYFYAEVSNRSVLKLLRKLHEASEHAMRHLDASRRVYLYINSPGGEVFAGFSAMDHIYWNSVPVVAVVDGFVASAATFLLLGATERKALRNSRILIHQLSASLWGKFTDLLDEVKNTQELMTSVKDLYSSQTHMTERRVDALLRQELHMNAQEALQCGFVDEIW